MFLFSIEKPERSSKKDTPLPQVMDITYSNFQTYFPSILREISCSRFVSIDLELSGIPPRQPYQARAHGVGYAKQTLQQRYAETKAAAEKYQVLQLGLTCVEEDLGRGCYVLRTYNFNLQPIPDQTLHIERDITIQSGALNFLRTQGFRLEDSFYTGVPYFSREEEVQSRVTEIARQGKSSLDTIALQPDDQYAQQFINGVRQQIEDRFYQAMSV